LKLSDFSTQDKVVLHFESKDPIATVGNFRSPLYQEGSYTVRLATILPVGTRDSHVCELKTFTHSDYVCVNLDFWLWQT